jgi:hypothetical protein
MGQAKMADQFRSSDVRRVSAVFDGLVPDPFATDVKIVDGGKGLVANVADPEDKFISVASVRFDYVVFAPNSPRRSLEQPVAAEVVGIAEMFKDICLAYNANAATT